MALHCTSCGAVQQSDDAECLWCSGSTDPANEVPSPPAGRTRAAASKAAEVGGSAVARARERSRPVSAAAGVAVGHASREGREALDRGKESYAAHSHFRALGGRLPRTAWLLWGLLGLLGAHRAYLKSWQSATQRCVVTVVLWASTVFLAKDVIPTVVSQFLPDLVATGTAEIQSNLATPTRAVDGVIDAGREGLVLILVLIGFAVLLAFTPVILWLMDIPWVARRLRVANARTQALMARRERGMTAHEQSTLRTDLMRLHNAGLLTEEELRRKEELLLGFPLGGRLDLERDESGAEDPWD